MKMISYKLKPNKTQLEEIEETLETCRRLYNNIIATQREQHLSGESFIRFVDLRKLFITESRKSDPYLSKVSYDILANTIKRTDLAYQRFFSDLKKWQKNPTANKPGAPRFKQRHEFDSFTDPAFGFGKTFPIVRKGQEGSKYAHVRMPLIGLVKMFYDRPLEGKPKTATYIRKPDGWYVCIACETEDAPLEPTGKTVGVDLGIENFAILSTGEFIENPRHMKKAAARIAMASRRLSRRKGPVKATKTAPSKRWMKARRLLAKHHYRVARARKEFHRQVVSDLIKSNDTIVVENLNVKGMIRNHHLAKHIADAGWGSFVLMLETKAKMTGRTVTKVNPAYTSQDCSGCGQRVIKKLSQRWHSCPYCGHEIHRDVNAAINIAAKG